MPNFVLQNQNAVYYECGYSCDNEIFIKFNDESFFITDPRYQIEAKEHLKNTNLIISNDLIKSARLLFRKFGNAKFSIDPNDFSVASFKNLSQNLSINFIPKPNFSKFKRIIKSKNEINLLKKAAKFGEIGFEKLADFLNNNSNLDEIKINFQASNLLKNNGEFGLSFEPITAINQNAAKAHALPTKTKLKKSDLLLVDAGVIYQRYCSDRTRTAVFDGKIKFNKNQTFKNQKQNEIFEIVRAAQEKAIKSIKPGIKACEIDFVAREFIQKAGFGEYFSHSTGHGVGLDIHEFPMISQSSQMMIEEGMVFSVEPGIYLENEFGIRIEDVVVVTKNGCEIL